MQDEHLQLTRVQELLGQHGVHIPSTTLERLVWRLGYRPRHGRRGDTVRMAPTPPGEVAEIDFERLGLLLNRHVHSRSYYGATATGGPNQDDLAQAQALDRRVARYTRWLRAGGGDDTDEVGGGLFTERGARHDFTS